MNTTKQIKTRRNHIGMFTATMFLESGRIYGHGKTRQEAEDAARRIFAALEVYRSEHQS
jgi:hypothetical protein